MSNVYFISTDKEKINIQLVHDYLCNSSYWAAGIPIGTLKRSIENSLCFGVYGPHGQIGFARVISDLATYAYLADVFIIEQERGKGLAKQLIKYVLEYPQLQGLRRFTLATRDAHPLYAQFAFSVFAKPERWMEIHNPDVYKR